MKRLQVEISCPKCGGSQLWVEHQRINRCEFCGSILYFQYDIGHHFYIEPRATSVEDVKRALVVTHAMRERAEKTARYSTGHDEHPELLTAIPVALAPFIAQMESAIEVQSAQLLLAPYWHFQAMLYQCVLIQNAHSKAYAIRRMPVDEAMAAYDDAKWNFRDRGLRFGEARLKETTRHLVSTTPHFEFIDNTRPALERLLRAFRPADPNETCSFKFPVLSESKKLPVFRPYWVVQYYLRGPQRALVDATLGTVAGHPTPLEYQRLVEHQIKPYADNDPPRVKVISSRCPVCGNDTKWPPTVTLHFCGNCGRMLKLDSGKVKIQPYSYTNSDTNSKNKNCVLIPFWRFPVRLSDGRAIYDSLRLYYKTLFAERLLKNCHATDSLWIPATRIKTFRKGDQLLDALIGDAPQLGSQLHEGPVSPPADVLPVDLDAEAALEILPCALPGASQIHPALHKLGTLNKMLKQTRIDANEPQLVLAAYGLVGENIFAGKKAFSRHLFDQ